jgi:hypothetical protein
MEGLAYHENQSRNPVSHYHFQEKRWRLGEIAILGRINSFLCA